MTTKFPPTGEPGSIWIVPEKSLRETMMELTEAINALSANLDRFLPPGAHLIWPCGRLEQDVGVIKYESS